MDSWQNFKSKIQLQITKDKTQQSQTIQTKSNKAKQTQTTKPKKTFWKIFKFQQTFKQTLNLQVFFNLQDVQI